MTHSAHERPHERSLFRLTEALSQISVMVSEIERYSGSFGMSYAPNWRDVRRAAEEIWEEAVCEGIFGDDPVSGMRALADVSTSAGYQALVALRSKIDVPDPDDDCLFCDGSPESERGRLCDTDGALE